MNIYAPFLIFWLLGMIYQPLITDSDNNMVFEMESASVMLADALPEESISISTSAMQALSGLGISVTGSQIYNTQCNIT